MSLEVLGAERIEELFADGVDLGDPFTVLALANLSVERLRNADTSELSDVERRFFTQGVENLRNQADAAAVDAARQVEAAGHERASGFFSTAAWVRHHLQLSASEARVRMQIVRLLDAVPAWERAARNGLIGVEQLRAAARTFALDTVREAFVEQSDRLLDDAVECSFPVFEERLANLRRLADPNTARRDAERRHVTIRRRGDGTWRLTGSFGDTQGAELNEILAHFNDAEWRSDWADAVERHGDTAGIDDLARTEPQRRADAFHHALLAAAERPSDGRAPLPTLNVLIDARTLETELTGGTHDPARYRTMVCRTQAGEPLDLAEASAMTLWANIRRVVPDTAGTVIDLGRRRRLFTGSARDAVMLTETHCLWAGCDAPIRRTQADHTIEWMHRSGTTSPHNGAPLCGRHNRHTHRHHTRVFKDTHGEWHITHPDGTPID